MVKLNRSRVSWLLYDFANSSFHLLVITVLFPLYFRKALFLDESNVDFSWALTVSAPVFFVGIIAPFLGAIADQYYNRAIIFGMSLVLSVTPIFVLVIYVPSQLAQALLFSLSLVGFHITLFIYDSYLVDQSDRERDRTLLSGIGWSLGYAGGLVCMVLVYPLLKGAELPEAEATYRTVFLIVSAFFFIFSIPAIVEFSSARKIKNYSKPYTGIITSIQNVFTTIKSWRKHRELFKYLLAFYLINDGLTTLIYFTSIFASATLELTTSQILIGFLIVQLVGIPATILISYLAVNIGLKKTLLFLVFGWIVLVGAFLIAETVTEYYILSSFVGCLIGSTPALGRSLLSTMVSRTGSRTKFFGFNAFSSRVSSVLGPLIFGIISVISGNQKLALASIAVFFVLGFLILRSVNEEDELL